MAADDRDPDPVNMSDRNAESMVAQGDRDEIRTLLWVGMVVVVIALAAYAGNSVYRRDRNNTVANNDTVTTANTPSVNTPGSSDTGTTSTTSSNMANTPDNSAVRTGNTGAPTEHPMGATGAAAGSSASPTGNATMGNAGQ